MKRIFYPKEYCICDICKKESIEFVVFIDDEIKSQILTKNGYFLDKINNHHCLCKQCFEKQFGDFEEARRKDELFLYSNF